MNADIESELCAFGGREFSSSVTEEAEPAEPTSVHFPHSLHLWSHLVDYFIKARAAEDPSC